MHPFLSLGQFCMVGPAFHLGSMVCYLWAQLQTSIWISCYIYTCCKMSLEWGRRNQKQWFPAQWLRHKEEQLLALSFIVPFRAEPCECFITSKLSLRFTFPIVLLLGLITIQWLRNSLYNTLTTHWRFLCAFHAGVIGSFRDHLYGQQCDIVSTLESSLVHLHTFYKRLAT